MMRQPGLSAESQRWEMRGGLDCNFTAPSGTEENKADRLHGAAGACAVAAFQQYAVETSDPEADLCDCILAV